jgi:uncharacterized protein (DUF1501 family)
MQTILAQQQEPAPVLVSIFLRGGADGLHLVPPVADDAYHRSRPSIAVSPSAALRLDETFGLHPALAALHPLFREGALGIVHQCGTADETRSHFSAEDFLHHGGLEGGGWIGRFLHHSRRTDDGPLTAVSIGPNVADSLRGSAAVAMRSLEEFTIGASNPSLRQQLGQLYQQSGGPLGSAGAATLTALARIESVQRQQDSAVSAAAGYGNDEFSSGLRLIARLIRARAGLRAATIELGGWDSHFAQLTLTASLMTRLAGGLAAFHRDLGNELRRVHVVVTTEFGRRLAENVSAGTDHGRAGTCFCMGGGIAGGKVIADWPQGGLGSGLLDGPGDLPVRFPLHHALAGIVHRMQPDIATERVFPGLSPGVLSL